MFAGTYTALAIAICFPLVAFADGKDGGQSTSPPPAGTVASSPSHDEAADLSEERQTLLGEVRYAKAKLDLAQKQFAAESAAGNVEKTEHLQEEIKDWTSRYDTAKAQLKEVEKQIADVSQGRGGTAVVDEVVVPGENLEVFVNEDPSFNGIYKVRRGGYIIMPQVGRIAVAGKSIPSAEAAVKRALEASQLPKATIMIVRKPEAALENGPIIYLAGEFRESRPWRIPAGITPTLVNVILSSGGVTEMADITRVRVLYGGRKADETVNVAKILDGQGPNSDVTLSDGDVIVIPKSDVPANQLKARRNWWAPILIPRRRRPAGSDPNGA